jgi:hypothetical protein
MLKEIRYEPGERNAARIGYGPAWPPPGAMLQKAYGLQDQCQKSLPNNLASGGCKPTDSSFFCQLLESKLDE